MIGCCELDLFFDETEMELPVEIEEQINVVFNEEISEELEKIKEQLKETETALENKINELESVQGELTETQADLTETTENLQAKTDELNSFTEEVNGVKDGLKEVAQSVDPTFITDSTAFVDYPEQFEKVVASAEHFGHTAGVNEENLRWTNLVNSATATAEDVAKGKTFVDDYGEIKDGTLDVEAIKTEAEKDFLSELWNNIQQFGARTDYQNFGQVIWTKKNFKPTYDFRPANAYLLFANGSAKYREQRKKDGMIIMKDLEQEQGITFDFSNCTQFHDAFQNSPFIELNVIDLSRATYTGSAFYGGASGGEFSQMLRKIERLICSNTTPFISSTFGYASQFTYIGFEGVIAQNGLDLHWSTILNKESHIKLINTLSSTTSGLSVTVSKTAVNKAFETSSGANDGSTSQEWLNLIATKSNWTISIG